MTLNSKVMRFLQDKSKSLPPKMSNANLTDLVEFLKIQGFNIKLWMSKVNGQNLTKRMTCKFCLGTKAQSLQRLEEVISLSKIAPQVSFTVAEWNKDSKKLYLIFKASLNQKN